MIHLTSSSDRAGGADAVSLNLPKAPVRPAPSDPTDSVSTANADDLRSALASQPEIRPDMVARGRALAADPSYPSAELLKRVAGVILNSPDLSDDES
jgi:hypothetical protein